MNSTKRVMISQPMNGIPDDEIKQTREKAKTKLVELGYEFVDSYLEEDFKRGVAPENVRNIPVNYLSRSIEIMSTCDAVYFCKGWDMARGCKIEHLIAVKYDLEVIEEE